MEKNKRLPSHLINLVQSPENPVFLSVASIWEMVIKKGKGRLKVPKNIEKDVTTAGFSIISIDASHVLGVQELPLYHKDPFDRLLVSQAKVENLTLLTVDPKIKRYDIKTLG
ncbi:hypothetical protein A3I53_01630 [Candidatus Curtissbacteria bacterium RIFCSPLOWO2_02_FULL_40_13b]|uniref:PIN domain-containing protein n=3 Tax=Candidatus Curtissiibacteriota TaxID=1752717 RepID=A0A1F5HP08_9BACT|nr:MAG: hypothetical protein A2693_04395 [Candidatus Curtissbacteria bacterium RIFCSPHIGHO2_01_FULL_40_12]OGE04426.1 MAG: hypothetical protein A3F45_00835 [Candidatus Curtissbacteria bacterium RIFCSPHIGHO2_12_FULL_41_17]OGE05874.1 MAG: hypothetical protein A3I53_01630 [Candidatus Curtissbacteria bacterium RIFCSPLOWO2_02_FULL_40_13b]